MARKSRSYEGRNRGASVTIVVTKRARKERVNRKHYNKRMWQISNA